MYNLAPTSFPLKTNLFSSFFSDILHLLHNSYALLCIISAFFVYKLVRSLREKEKAKEEKKKMKTQRKEKEAARKLKKR